MRRTKAAYSSDGFDDGGSRKKTSTRRALKNLDLAREDNHQVKRRRILSKKDNNMDMFDCLPDDLVILILSKLSFSASSPSDLINVLLTCKRFNGLGLHRLVLSKASLKALGIRATKWSDSTHRFLKLCADSGNVDALYTLGMIRFYCLQNRGSGASLMAKAAIQFHAPALYSLAVIQFNGSGGSKNDKDLRAGVALCSRAALLGHIDALREFGHCLQDGYGIRRNVAEGRKFLVQANARELAAVFASTQAKKFPSTHGLVEWNPDGNCGNGGAGCPLLSDFGCSVPAPEVHPANRFLSEWFAGLGGESGPGLRMCSHSGCGRPETRKHEFRRCSVCGAVNYCSRACQALDWKLRHKAECVPLEDLHGWLGLHGWVIEEENNGGDAGFNGVGLGHGVIGADS